MTVRTFQISAAVDPQALPRVLGLFSQRWVVPGAFHAEVKGSMIEMRCEVSDLSAADLNVILAKLGEMVLVQDVSLCSPLPEAQRRSATG